ncbi:hypothetical protein [Novosphingobium sp. B1]|uniref:hypothetical protein n=1 Tax=Novosphingobium sp. B1 TaxID=1938756 RepID=UPI000A028AFF|nr:hypothetical protein [Novosphingobium sp. B1]
MTVLTGLALLFGATSAHAQQAGAASGPSAAPVQSDSEVARNLLTTSQTQRCRPMQRSDGTIVVCGGKEASDRERVPLRDETDGAKSTDDGLPRAPNVSGLRDCSRGCVGLGGKAREIYIFDIKALPPPPPGSDADRIAKGEIPAP